MIEIIVAGIPPSVNHYVGHTRGGAHYKTRETRCFLWEMMRSITREQRLRGSAYEISIIVYLGKNQRRDWDNVPKCVCDGLVELGVIDTDAKIKHGSVEILRDRKNPRTEIRLQEWSKSR